MKKTSDPAVFPRLHYSKHSRSRPHKPSLSMTGWLKATFGELLSLNTVTDVISSGAVRLSPSLCCSALICLSYLGITFGAPMPGKTVPANVRWQTRALLKNRAKHGEKLFKNTISGCFYRTSIYFDRVAVASGSAMCTNTSA